MLQAATRSMLHVKVNLTKLCHKKDN